MAKIGFHSKSFKEGIEILMDEITLACQWQRPSILLAIHASKTEQIKAQQALEKKIVKLNKRVKLIKAASKTPDVISIMCKTTNQDEIVFYISEFENAEGVIDGKIYNGLNMHRELLVEQHVRVVFWLTELEAEKLPHRAPDFWAFRHRVVEFAPIHGTKKSELPG
jgi:hypothetical protein